jgi:hypothetical protein
MKRRGDENMILCDSHLFLFGEIVFYNFESICVGHDNVTVTSRFLSQRVPARAQLRVLSHRHHGHRSSHQVGQVRQVGQVGQVYELFMSDCWGIGQVSFIRYRSGRLDWSDGSGRPVRSCESGRSDGLGGTG